MLKLKSAELTSSLETDKEDNKTKKRNITSTVPLLMQFTIDIATLPAFDIFETPS